MRYINRIWPKKHICDIRPIEKIYITPPTTELIKEHANNLKCERGSDHEIWPIKSDIIDGSYNYFWQCLTCYNDNEAIRVTYERIIKEVKSIIDIDLGRSCEPILEDVVYRLQEAEKYFQV